MRRIFSILVSLLTLALAWAAPAQDTPDRFAPVHARLQKFVDDGDLAGVVAAVGNSQGLLYLDALGWQNLETKTPMRKDSLFRIASMTKPITAIGIMMLIDEGKLSVDDPVEKHLPEFKNQQLLIGQRGAATFTRGPKRPITIRDLLTHTSGLAGSYPEGMKDLYTKRNHTLAEATAAIAKCNLEAEPGSRWAYCNPGIDTLGRIIEVASGQRYEEFLHARLFEPLGMKDTTFDPTPGQLARLAVTYDRQENHLIPARNLIVELVPNPKHPIPAGGLFSTAEDLATLYQVMLRRGTRGNTRFWSEASHAAMTQTQTGDLKTGFVDGMSWGFGWAVVKKPQGVTAMLSPGSYGHGGAFGTQAWIDPRQDLFIILLIQRTGLPNADASIFREELQRLAVEAVHGSRR